MTIDDRAYLDIIDNLHDGLYIVGKGRTITYWNKAAEAITGYTAGEVMGKSCADDLLIHVDENGNSLCKSTCPLAATIADGKPREIEVYLLHKKGHRVPISIRVSALTDARGQITGGIQLFTDISHRTTTELKIKELEKIALLDHLTQLANRHYIEKELISRFEEKQRFDIPFGILFLDIDKFKDFNDTYGHKIGDEVLRTVAKTFMANSRPFDLYGRWGGEEFIGIIRNINAENLELIGNRIRKLVENSRIHHRDRHLNVTISIGATMVEKSDTIDGIIKRADALLYESKTAGRNRLTMG